LVEKSSLQNGLSRKFASKLNGRSRAAILEIKTSTYTVHYYQTSEPWMLITKWNCY